MKSISTVLWDWNGTLLNDVSLCCELINSQLKRHGYAPLGNVQAYRNVFCFPIETYYQKAGFDFSRTPYLILAQEYTAAYNARSKTCALQPGAIPTLEKIRQMGLHQRILSASQRDILALQVASYHLEQYFDGLLGLDDVYAKSKIAVGLQWLQESGTPPDSIVMVGDSVHDFEVAQALGAQCVLFTGGHQPHTLLQATGAHVIDHLTDLPALLT